MADECERIKLSGNAEKRDEKLLLKKLNNKERAGELESWRAGELESWRAGELESWRTFTIIH